MTPRQLLFSPRSRHALLVTVVLIIALALPWALRGYMQWWELAFRWKCGTAVDRMLPRVQ